MAFSKDELSRLYRRRAGNYDFTANLYYVIGFRETSYRKKAVRWLNLEPGGTVVEIGCGTGLNFRFLREAVGPEGRIIGVDLTPEMLDRAQARIRHNNWKNVELVQSDAASYRFPEGVDGIISTFAITLMPEFDEIIERGAKALAPGRRLVIADLRKPESWPELLVNLFVILTRPFGVTIDLADRKPWESVECYLKPVAYEEVYFGAVYISSGEAY